MILFKNALPFMCYIIILASCYYPRKDVHAFRIELEHTSSALSLRANH